MDLVECLEKRIEVKKVNKIKNVNNSLCYYRIIKRKN